MPADMIQQIEELSGQKGFKSFSHATRYAIERGLAAEQVPDPGPDSAATPRAPGNTPRGGSGPLFRVRVTGYFRCVGCGQAVLAGEAAEHNLQTMRAVCPDCHDTGGGPRDE